jgi:hypothetical protein
MQRSLVLGCILLACACIVIAGTARPAMTQAQPSASPQPSGTCRNEDSGPNCPCDNPANVRNAQGKCAPPSTPPAKCTDDQRQHACNKVKAQCFVTNEPADFDQCKSIACDGVPCDGNKEANSSINWFPPICTDPQELDKYQTYVRNCLDSCPKTKFCWSAGEPENVAWAGPKCSCWDKCASTAPENFCH